MRISSLFAALVSLAAASAFAQAVGPREDNPALRVPQAATALRDTGGDTGGDSSRIIVKFRSGNPSGRVQAQAASDRAGSLAVRTGLAMRETRALSFGLQLVRVDAANSGVSFAEQLARIRADSDVEFAEPDQRRFPHAVPTDPLYAGQWYLQNRVDTPSAVNAEAAWDLTTGDPGVIVAVIDTGVLSGHPDLKSMAAGGRILPGYDFIANPVVANDGGGRDADATDAGDWVTQTEANAAGGQFEDCTVGNSSWHGTRVAGIIGAIANNAEGITGSTWSPWILPVRALGKCGGFDSDIIDAMAWAGGLPVQGAPANPFPARVENLSLGAPGPCSNAYRTVVNELAVHGVLVVVSAGNEGGPVASPANCAGVAAVAGLRHIGTKVGFSSLGPEVAIGAPGGNCVNTNGGPCLFSIDTTFNLGTTTAGAFSYTNQTNVNVGTSFSAPIVSGIVALMASVNGNLSTAQLISRLREGAKTPFPTSPDTTILACRVPTGPNDIQDTECNCTTSTCGAGMASSLGAVTAALRPIVSIATPGPVTAGQLVALNASGSVAANGRTIATYLWSMLCGGGAPTSPGSATTSILAPLSGSITVLLTITDDVGRQDAAKVIVTPTSATVTTGAGACPPVAVTASPDTASVQAGNTQAFTAVVTNAQNTAVTWQVNGVAGGNATVGTVSTLGVFTAPASVPSPSVVTVAATSAEDPTKSGSAQVTITAPPAPAPAPAQSGGGGGGAGGELLLLLCAFTAFARLTPSKVRAIAARTVRNN